MKRKRNDTVLFVGVGVLAVVGYLLYSKSASAATLAAGAAGAGAGGASAGAGVGPASLPGVDLQAIGVDAGGALPALPGSLAPTGASVAQAGTFWTTLAPATGQVPSTGFINFPSGAQSAAGIFAQYQQYREDGAGNLYVQWGGQVYQVGPQDGSGNWPALLIG